MGARIWGIVMFMILARCAARKGSEDEGLCPRLSLGEAFLFQEDSCTASGRLYHHPIASVVEGDENTLYKIMYLVHKSKGSYVALFFYASWCPFSKTCRPHFDNLQTLFPTIHHLAIEESSVRPSVLSKYGVHGFPTLFLLNSTVRVRYRGSRTIDSLIAFYRDVTGNEPKPVAPSSLGKQAHSIRNSAPMENLEQENCPFSWARSPEKLFQQDTYLAFAIIFVMIRIFHFLCPKFLACLNHIWGRHIQYVGLINLSQACFRHAKQAVNLLNPSIQKRLQGAKHVPAWASKPLPSVSIGETSIGSVRSNIERR